MKTKKTSFRVTSSALQFQNILVKAMDIPRTTFHKKMIDYFLKNEMGIHPSLLITNRTDPNYIKKDATEQIYLDVIREAELQKVAEKYGCKIGTILFQAMMEYSVSIAPEVLGKDDLRKLFPEKKKNA